nr:glycosyltransferase family A protein [Ancylobacter gelatini]
MREAFHAARATPDYQSAFEEAEPLVTICISTYNRAELLLERCLASIRKQTYSRLQVIIVGDHCTDDTEERVRGLGDPRIEFYNLDKPSIYPAPGPDRWRVAGTTPANFARQFARGRFITHLDEDDAYADSRIEKVVAAAQQNRADIVWHKFWQENPDASWQEAGNGTFAFSQIGLGMCLYHEFFLKLSGDIHAYRSNEPGDWHSLRRMKHLRPRLHFVDEALTYYHHFPRRAPYQPVPGEAYLE